MAYGLKATSCDPLREYVTTHLTLQGRVFIGRSVSLSILTKQGIGSY